MCVELQDVIDRESQPSLHSSAPYRDQDSDRDAGITSAAATDGFSVRGAPWSSITVAPDTNSMDDFPDLTQVDRHYTLR